MPSGLNVLLLVVAGVAAGLGGSIGGIASVFSYPALLSVGLSPIDANVTNSVSLFFLSVGSVTSSKRELKGRAKLLRRIGPINLIGGVIGAVLLLKTSSATFKHIVPFLILAASLAILLPSRKDIGDKPRVQSKALPIMTGVIGIYCGYFGAASGSLTLALILRRLGVELPVASAIKNVLMGISNGIAAIIFIFIGHHIHWLIAIPLAIGFFIGGRIGPIIIRNSSAKMLRLGISIFGLIVATALFIKH
jgi:uncharacterized protein